MTHGTTNPDPLAALEFKPACETPRCRSAAGVTIMCRLCKRTELVCDDHLTAYIAANATCPCRQTPFLEAFALASIDGKQA
jgi:hypothetical protein